MNSDPASSPLLDEAHAAFNQRRVLILVGSCSAEGVPSLARAYGCRVSPDHHSVTVFLAVPQSEALLRGLRASGAIAVVFSRPSTHETLQFKGSVQRMSPVEADDRPAIRAYGRSFAEEVAPLGFDEPFQDAIMAPVEHEAVAVIFYEVLDVEQVFGAAPDPGTSRARPAVSAARLRRPRTPVRRNAGYARAPLRDRLLDAADARSRPRASVHSREPGLPGVRGRREVHVGDGIIGVSGRGRFRLEVARPLHLAEVPTG
jgi:hypothetical protein